MIKINAEKRGRHFLLEVSGHADFSKTNDIVCAAVSTLYYTLASAVCKEKSVKSLSRFEKSGFAQIEFFAPESFNTAFKTVTTGFALISEQYPNNVGLKYKNN